MRSWLMRVLEEAEGNIYNGINIGNGTIVFFWTLLCLFFVNSSSSFAVYASSGGLYYASVVLLGIYLFKDLGGYLCFPIKNKKMPVFIGHKPDTLLTYPILLMAAAGLISSLLSATGLFPAPPQADVAGSSGWAEAVRLLLMPLLAYGEELINLLMVSFIYKYIKLKGKYRIITSVLSGALIFGLMHTFGQGIGAGILIGASHAPIIFAALYTGNIWVSALAHLYNNLISYAKAYNSGLHLAIIAAVSVMPVVWAVKETLKKPH